MKPALAETAHSAGHRMPGSRVGGGGSQAQYTSAPSGGNAANGTFYSTADFRPQWVKDAQSVLASPGGVGGRGVTSDGTYSYDAAGNLATRIAQATGITTTYTGCTIPPYRDRATLDSG